MKRGSSMGIVAKFPLGTVVATPNALSQIPLAEITAFLRRHVSGDWGDLCAEDWQHNETALVEGTRLLSSYKAQNGLTVWIISEADRSVTTILMPEDY